MKIEKKKITGNKSLSTATKSAIAATLGMAAAFTLNACDDSSSPTSGQVAEPIDNSSSSEDSVLPDSANSPETTSSVSQTEGAASSSQVENLNQSETAPSSSSKIVDIPLSQEPVSSSVAEAISSLMESSSSQAAPESSEAAPTSSTVAPGSSSEATPASSDDTPSSSSHSGWNYWPADPSSSSKDYSDVCPDNDPWCIHVHMCEDRPDGCMAASMVTTFERDDITG